VSGHDIAAIPAIALTTNPIEIQAEPSSETFQRTYIRDGGRPVIFENARILGPDRRTLTFDYLKRALGHLQLTASAPQFSGSSFDESRSCRMRMRADDYIDYVLDPRQEPKGTWERGDWPSLQKLGIPLYCGTLDPHRYFPASHHFWTIFHPSPSFTPDWSHYLPRFYKRACWQRAHHYLYLAAPGALTPLHFDFWDTHAYLCQVTGSKFCVLFSPEDSEHIYRGAIDPLALDFSRHPNARQAVAWVGMLREGQTLFVPSRWWHYVVTERTSITLSYDWFDSTNCRSYLKHSSRLVWQVYVNRLRRAFMRRPRAGR